MSAVQNGPCQSNWHQAMLTILEKQHIDQQMMNVSNTDMISMKYTTLHSLILLQIWVTLHHVIIMKSAPICTCAKMSLIIFLSDTLHTGSNFLELIYNTSLKL